LPPPTPTPTHPTYGTPLAAAPTAFTAGLQIPKAVWDEMGPRAQADAARAGAQRAVLARMPLLLSLGKTLPLSDAVRLGVTVLHGDTSDSSVSVGVCNLPRLDNAVQSPPKSEWM
jgi:hypothetical protein